MVGFKFLPPVFVLLYWDVNVSASLSLAFSSFNMAVEANAGEGALNLNSRDPDLAEWASVVFVFPTDDLWSVIGFLAVFLFSRNN